jgi:L,D-peptidoglycan transpeptidase YkuD (ErfK/YbiS/YcfS/YnhG family)
MLGRQRPPRKITGQTIRQSRWQREAQKTNGKPESCLVTQSNEWWKKKKFVLVGLRGPPITARSSDGATPEHVFGSAIADF